MRPLRLTMTAFGPYAGTETVDFDALTELGLFVVAGNNGSGKTTIFDALHYSLYGTLPGRRANYPDLRSDHAAADVDCTVTLDFRAHGADWRVERSPAQTRAKRRGTGTTEASPQALLSRLTNGTPVAVTKRLEEVRAKCTELVGLSSKQFERVALLPQGEFSRVLQEGTTERRQLLRTLFSSEIFGDATSLLHERATQASAKDQARLQALDLQQAALAQELTDIVTQPVANATADITAAIASVRDEQLAAIETQARDQQVQAETALENHRLAADTAQRIGRRAVLEQQLAAHLVGGDQHRLDTQRLQQALAAVPVATNAGSLDQHEHHLSTASSHIDQLVRQANRAFAAAGVPPLPVNGQASAVATVHTLHHDLEPAINSSGSELTALLEWLADRHQINARVRDLNAAVAQTQGVLRRRANEAAALDDQEIIATTTVRQASAELNELAQIPDADQCERNVREASAALERRLAFDTAQEKHRAGTQAAAELDTKITELQDQQEAAHQAHSEHAKLQAKADQALHAFELAADRRQAADDFLAAQEQITASRRNLRDAQDLADAVWDGFIAGTAARVAQALVEDEPCPVCGSEQHPSPAVADTVEPATETDVTAARASVEALRAGHDQIQTQVETLRDRHPAIASWSLTELDAAAATAKAMAFGAREVADQALQRSSNLQTITAELRSTQTRRSELATELGQLEQERSRLEGALSDLAVQPLAELERAVTHTQQAQAAARDLEQRCNDLTKRVAHAQDSLDQIGLKQITKKSQQTSATDQLADRQADLDQANAQLAQLNHKLAPSSPQGSTDGADAERRTKAARHAQQLLDQLGKALAAHHEAFDAVRRSRSIVADRVAQSPFASIDDARNAFLDPEIVEQLKAQIDGFTTTCDRLRGQLEELADLPAEMPDVATLAELSQQANDRYQTTYRAHIELATIVDRISAEITRIADERASSSANDLEVRRLERVAALVKGDNDRNTSLENWVLAAHLRDVVELANIRLARSTHQRFQLCVLDDGSNKRGTWGLDLGVEDTVTGTQRSTAGLSGGELFQASLALALGLADAVMNQSSGVHIDALFIDEGFGALDENSVERAIDLLDELRDQGALVGVITHVPALLDALPRGVSVVDAVDGPGSTIRQDRAA